MTRRRQVAIATVAAVVGAAAATFGALCLLGSSVELV
jgi:hypothetical protein